MLHEIPNYIKLKKLKTTIAIRKNEITFTNLDLNIILLKSYNIESKVKDNLGYRMFLL